MIKIIVDSGCDISQSESVFKNITVLPLKTIFGEKEYKDGIDIGIDEFYDKLIESDVLPKTSQCTPDEYATAFAKALTNHDSVIYLTVSSALSGCYQSASIAASDFSDRVFVVDSENATLGYRNLVELAIRLRDEGKEAGEIVEILNRKKKQLRLVALPSTLEYLKKGGRLSAAAALAGTLLSIKPVIAIEEGKAVVLGKARGTKAANNLLSECVAKNGQIDMSLPYCVAYSGYSDAILRKYLDDFGDRFEFDREKIPVLRIGSTIGTHVGPGAIAVSFFSET